MSSIDISSSARRPALRLVASSLRPAGVTGGAPEWRRVAAAVLGCTRELGRHLMQQRWGRVDEAMEERRELLILMKRMYLDADGRRCLLALEQATHESELAVDAMTTGRRTAQRS
ncbi:MAG TPA: hypothetical protein VK624_22400 [Steroidobacteraceae bacterium]|nr:hypothetical protein [Steroidobacteraceae bacterium]